MHWFFLLITWCDYAHHSFVMRCHCALIVQSVCVDYIISRWLDVIMYHFLMCNHYVNKILFADCSCVKDGLRGLIMCRRCAYRFDYVVIALSVCWMKLIVYWFLLCTTRTHAPLDDSALIFAMYSSGSCSHGWLRVDFCYVQLRPLWLWLRQCWFFLCTAEGKNDKIAKLWLWHDVILPLRCTQQKINHSLP